MHSPYRPHIAVASILLMVIATNIHADEAAEPANPVSLTAGFDITTAYFFRGIGQENNGFIIQPWVDVGFSLYEGDGTIGSVAVNVGVWESLHDAKTFHSPDSHPDNWYEADYYVGITVGLLDKWTTSFVYTWYDSPNDAFATIEDLAWSLAYADEMGLNPTLTFIWETENQADAGSDLGTYFSIGIEPTFTVIQSEEASVTLAVPVLVVFDVDDYFESPVDGDTDGFAYVDVGAVLSMPATFMPEGWGSWTMSLGVHVLFLNDSLQELSNGNGTGGDDVEFIGTFGMSVEF